MRRTIADLDLTYYLPCTVRGRTIAYIGLSRTGTATIFRASTWNCWSRSPVTSAIAIENATLYRSLQRKVEEYERLKEFSENIVESINVGILAADLEDRVESWNTQIEQLTGIAARRRARAGSSRELFPAATDGAVRPRARRDRDSPHLQVRAQAWRADGDRCGRNGHGNGNGNGHPPRAS